MSSPDRQEQIEILLDHFRNPTHHGQLEDATVIMPGGNPGCGDVITIYLKPNADGSVVDDVTWEGEGCTISQAAASILMEMVHDENWTMEGILEHDDPRRRFVNERTQLLERRLHVLVQVGEHKVVSDHPYVEPGDLGRVDLLGQGVALLEKNLGEQVVCSRVVCTAAVSQLSEALLKAILVDLT